MTKSLGALLAIGLAGLQFLAVLAVVFSSYLTSERALIQHAHELLRDVGTNTIEHSRGFLNPAEGAAELAARLAQNRVVASDNPQLLEQLLFQQLQIAPQVSGVYYGAEDGTFVFVMRYSQGPGPFRSKLITFDAEGRRQVDLIWRAKDFTRLAHQADPDDPYEARDRLWYTRAKSEQTTIWTDPYIFFSSQHPGITLAAPVMGEGGQVRGVVGVDIEISEISNFLARLNIGDTGKALVIHKNGDVIAHPNPEMIKTTNEDGTLSFANLTEFEDPIVTAAFGPLLRDGEMQVMRETASDFTFRGARYVASVMPMMSDKLPWTIAVYAPESDFTGAIKQNRTTNIWIAALVAAITGLVGLMLASYIHKPVRAFAVRSALVAQGEIDPAEPMPKTYRELERANETLVQEIMARRETEREYNQTFDQSSRAMAQISPADGTIIRANASFGALVGAPPEAVVGRSLADVAHPEDLAQYTRDGCLSGDNTSNVEMRWIRRDGHQIWVKLNAILIRGEKGRELHSVLTVDDITQEKSRDHQIQQLSRDLSHLARGHTMGQMASGLAHELNQPLTAIAQNADAALLMLDHPADHSADHFAARASGTQLAAPIAAQAELREILEEIEQQSLRAGEIIRALRGFVRKDEGSTMGFDFAELLTQSLRLVHAEAVEAGVVIDAAPDPGLPGIEANRVQIAQVIVNLARNAIEAMADGRDNTRRLTIRAHSGPEDVTVSFEDTGPGISPDIQLFSQFETSKPGGMGLGLSICRSIVEANGGALWLDPDHERGARFLFTLPTGRAA
ncbi:sensor histidine kinase [Pseudogemmobacter sonorensis]|uniref:sensor histidine kinase n=1 Tax=Pseudogemmobacter sonorensis TaxID=2989681 RepID=UPI0036A03150